MKITGHSLIAGETVAGNGATTAAVNPATNESITPTFTLVDEQQLQLATTAAADAFPSFNSLAPDLHAAFLETIADNIEALGSSLIERAMEETGLPAARLEGERSRTVNQLKLFAAVVRQGDFRGVRIDPAVPDRTPLPRPDIRQRRVPLGPVAVFGASNFPLAFSTAGGDTASALAAGCPVVFKAHNAHPGTSELVGHAIVEAARSLKLHPGVFSLVFGPGRSIGQALATDPAIKAVGFTGSRAAGVSLMQAAARRPEPIPVYAEMSSLNPVFVFPGALLGDVDSLAQGYVTSVTASSGQLCTSPGLIFVPTGEHGDRFLRSVSEAVRSVEGQTMLTQGIASSWAEGTQALKEGPKVRLVAEGSDGPTQNAPAPAVFETSVDSFVQNSALHEEVFGSTSLAIRYSGMEELVEAILRLDGQLTASLQVGTSDHVGAAALIPMLEAKVGRIIVNGWPTGVEVGHAMVHGGPFPATSDSRTTSVGTLAIERFLRPVAYQNVPDVLLPSALKDENPWRLNRLLDGSPEAQRTRV